MWEYERVGDGRWVPQSPAAPPWSLEAWHASLDVDGVDPAVRESLEASLLETATGGIPKSAEDLAELRRLDPIADLDEQLEQQRLREWSSYGEALKARVEAGAAAIPGLAVPVTVRKDARQSVAHSTGITRIGHLGEAVQQPGHVFRRDLGMLAELLKGRRDQR
ncbi:hypothetical protein [Streptomyces sp. NPDC097610]|uniref:hypothetical protein n=1 Tax=Streptomyces sp. NPDC097610 TaxID=3157227 RepID=UPI00331908C1